MTVNTKEPLDLGQVRATINGKSAIELTGDGIFNVAEDPLNPGRIVISEDTEAFSAAVETAVNNNPNIEVGGGASDAVDLSYDDTKVNTVSLNKDNVQDAIDALKVNANSLSSTVTGIDSRVSNIEENGGGSARFVLLIYHVAETEDGEQTLAYRGGLEPGSTYNYSNYNPGAGLCVLGLKSGSDPLVGNADTNKTIKVIVTRDTWNATTNETELSASNEGDGIPDKYQVVFNYTTAENGLVAGAPAKIVITLGDGVTSANIVPTKPSGYTLTPNEGYGLGGWVGGLNPNASMAVQGGHEYTFTPIFVQKKITRNFVDSANTSTIIDSAEEYFATGESYNYSSNPGIPLNYALDGSLPANISGTVGDSDITITIPVTLDIWNAANNTTSSVGAGGGDNTGDKYQVKLVFTTSNSSWGKIKDTENGNQELETVTKIITLPGTNSTSATLNLTNATTVTLTNGGSTTTVPVQGSVVNGYFFNSWKYNNTKTASMTVQGGQTYNITCEFVEYELYGYRVDTKTTSDPKAAVSYLTTIHTNTINRNWASNTTDETANLAYMDYSSDKFHPGKWKAEDVFFMDVKPRVLNSNGQIYQELNPNDYSKTNTGSGSTITNASYNVMVGFPLMFIKRVQIKEGIYEVYICNKRIDNNFHAYTHISPDSTKTEAQIDAANEYLPYSYMSAYDGSVSGTKLVSISGQTPANTVAINTLMQYCRNNNTSLNIWEGCLNSQRQMLIDLCVMISKTLDSQTAFGEGNTTGGSSAASLKQTGLLNNKGLFYGKATATSKTDSVKVFGIENPWGNLWKVLVGAITKDNHWYTKMTRGTQDGSSAVGYDITDGNTYTNYVDQGVCSSGWMARAEVGAHGIYGKATSATVGGTSVNGSATVFYCDDFLSYASLCVGVVGGSASSTAVCGVFYWTCDSWTASHWGHGCGLSCLPAA